MILKLSKGGLNGGEYKFAISDDFNTSFKNNLTFDLAREASRTHPSIVVWEGSQIEDQSVKLVLAVDALKDDVGVSQIPSVLHLIRIVEHLHDWALPPDVNNPAYLEAINVTVGGRNGFWFYRLAYIQGIGCKFKPPWDVDTGMPMVAEIDLSLKFTLSPGGTTIGKGAVAENRFRPHRPWKFNDVWR